MTAWQKFLSFFVSIYLFLQALFCGPVFLTEQPPGYDNQMGIYPDTYAAVDALGRVLPGNAETGGVREGKFVGMFYWTWHYSHSSWTAPFNVTQIIKDHPEAVGDISSPYWGTLGAPHFWNEPIYGYYQTADDYVLRRQAEMLANAGVDVIICDNTNGTFTWRESYTRVFEVFAKARAEGVNTPQVAFLLPFGAGDNTNTQLRALYEDIYKDGKYKDLWFFWEGRPLIMAYPDDLYIVDKTDREISQFFTFRPSQPSYTEGQKRQGHWGWLSVFPQQVYKRKDGSVEQISVGVAQNHSAERGLTPMNGENVFGRTYTSKGYDTREDAKLYGANFAEQFEYALQVDPDFIFVTGYNEWVAGRHEEWMGVENAFPDEYDDAFSRDIEPSKGDLKDNYYYQLVSYIRQYKGANPAPAASAMKTIDINGGISQWDDVLPEYNAYKGTENRDDDGYLTMHYENLTFRNDIIRSKVARDEDNFYFMVETADTLTSETGADWMQLFISTDLDIENGWEGMEFIVNRETPGVLEASIGGWDWDYAADVDYSADGNILQVKIPKALLGGVDGLYFKWADNWAADGEEGDILNFYTNGDVAPGGRFMYAYNK
ncbi:MAG: hypothetical protein FWF08_00800 [Oscillospiraceae bacterium]|nr:hypothetical protein [Oscillospiraceae bacterium]